MNRPTQDQITIPMELAEAALDDMISLKGEWHWWKDEPRCGRQEAYMVLCEEIEAMKEFLKRHKEPRSEGNFESDGN